MSAACYTDTRCGACAGFQPTFRAYAHAQGQPCTEAMLAADRVRYPTRGAMTGFIGWIAAAKIVAWRKDEGAVQKLSGGELQVWNVEVWHDWLRDPANWPAINAEARL